MIWLGAALIVLSWGALLMEVRAPTMRGTVAWMVAVVLLASAGSACLTTLDGRRTLHPLVPLAADSACAVAEAACAARGGDCTGLASACRATSSLLLAVERQGEADVVWYCVAYDEGDVENPGACLALPDGRCGVCWTDPREAVAAAGEL